MDITEQLRENLFPVRRAEGRAGCRVQMRYRLQGQVTQYHFPTELTGDSAGQYTSTPILYWLDEKAGITAKKEHELA